MPNNLASALFVDVTNCVPFIFMEYVLFGHCATSRKIAVSIPDGVIGIFINVILSARWVKVFENWMLRRILGPKRDEVTRVRRNYIIRSLMICNSRPILLG